MREEEEVDEEKWQEEGREGGMRKVKWAGREKCRTKGQENSITYSTLQILCVYFQVQLMYICTTINNANQQCPLVTTCVQHDTASRTHLHVSACTLSRS